MTTNSRSTATAIQEPMADEQEHPLAEAGHEVGRSAGHLAERAADIGFQRADEGRAQVASGLGELAGSIRRVSGDLGSEQPAIANVADTAAEQAERIATYLRDTDAREILRTVENVARRQPILFLGGAFVLGVAASRFIKAAGGTAGGDRWSGADAYGSFNGSGRSYGGGTGAIGSYQATGPGTTASATGTSGGDRLSSDEGL